MDKTKTMNKADKNENNMANTYLTKYKNAVKNSDVSKPYLKTETNSNTKDKAHHIIIVLKILLLGIIIFLHLIAISNIAINEVTSHTLIDTLPLILKL